MTNTSSMNGSTSVQVKRIGRVDPDLGRTRPEEPNTILLLHGPSSNLFGERNPAHYGTTTLAQIEERVTSFAQSVGLDVVCAQDNYEGAIIEHIHAARTYGAIIMNPNAFVHYSYAIRDALESVKTPYVEIHLSNMYQRGETEHHRKLNVTAAMSKGYICGCGVLGYDLAVLRAKALIDENAAQQNSTK